MAGDVAPRETHALMCDFLNMSIGNAGERGQAASGPRVASIWIGSPEADAYQLCFPLDQAEHLHGALGEALAWAAANPND
jgi:hypothetical protein